MKQLKKIVFISLLVAALALVVSCSGTASNTPAPSSPAPAPSTPITSTVPTPTPAPTPSLVIPTPTNVVIPTPTPPPTPTYDPSKDKKFFIDRLITGYNKIPRPDGSFDQTPIYQDYYLDLNILGYYTKSNSYFVPRIPTFTNFDDWFFRPTLPGYVTKPWIVNWGYTVNKASPNASKATLEVTIYTRELFDANYYKHPELLLNYNLKGDRGPSSSGVWGKFIQSPGDYAILVRTNDASAISDWWVKLGTEATLIASPTP